MNNRYDFIYLFDVKDGNPNGDPDAGNLPRIDPETGNGLVTDVCLKRKVRNFIQMVRDGQPSFDIYIQEKAILNKQHERAYEALKKDAKKAKQDDRDACRQWMCQNFYDIRAFGAVMTTEINCGQVRGPVQFSFARSIDPVVSSEHAVTRCAVTTEKEADKQSGDNRTMGRKFTIPYGLYQAHGFINPFLARQTGFGDDDLTLFWEALKNMFEHDRSAARGLMGAQKIIVFKHDSALGSAPANKLFDLVSVKRKESVEVPRSFSDYEVTIGKLPAGVEVIELL
ncbi:MAG: CRISPR-associated protein Csd2 family [Verrucomicrobiaceae bacterium]|nr:CRISPR-associated protein Csd2 family [Verrucomicrobiaceae bacterium]